MRTNFHTVDSMVSQMTETKTLSNADECWEQGRIDTFWTLVESPTGILAIQNSVCNERLQRRRQSKKNYARRKRARDLEEKLSLEASIEQRKRLKKKLGKQIKMLKNLKSELATARDECLQCVTTEIVTRTLAHSQTQLLSRHFTPSTPAKPSPQPMMLPAESAPTIIPQQVFPYSTKSHSAMPCVLLTGPLPQSTAEPAIASSLVTSMIMPPKGPHPRTAIMKVQPPSLLISKESTSISPSKITGDDPWYFEAVLDRLQAYNEIRKEKSGEDVLGTELWNMFRSNAANHA